MSERPTPETDAVAEKNIYGVACKVDVDFARKLERERDEARAVADELASVAARCLGWHDHECPDAAIKIAAAVKRWKKMRREL
jgi:hypothetical protein